MGGEDVLIWYVFVLLYFLDGTTLQPMHQPSCRSDTNLQPGVLRQRAAQLSIELLLFANDLASGLHFLSTMSVRGRMRTFAELRRSIYEHTNTHTTFGTTSELNNVTYVDRSNLKVPVSLSKSQMHE